MTQFLGGVSQNNPFIARSELYFNVLCFSYFSLSVNY